MPKTKISEYSATANSNTDVASINIDEGCAPSGINNAIRAVMGHLKDFQAGTNADSFNGPVGTTTAAAVAATTLTTSSTVTHNGGTANGVGYLNGSKVFTTGSALTFDGANLGVGVASPGAKLDVAGTIYTRGGNLLMANAAIDATSYINNPGGSGVSAIGFFTGGSEQMRLTSTGLGIGATSPAAKLDVQGSAIFARVKSTGTTYNGFRSQNDNGNFYFGLDDASGGFYGTANARVLYADGAYPMVFYTNAAEKMRLDSAGNLGLGVTPSASTLPTLESQYGLFVGQGQANIVANAYYNGGYLYKSSAAASRYQQITGQHIWYNAASGTAGNAITFTQAMTLDASGRLLLGTTSYALSNDNNLMLDPEYGIIFHQHASGTGSGALYSSFAYNGTQIGSITQSGTTAVLYNLTSDQRLKENIVDAASASALIDAIQVRQYNWKSDGSFQRYGFVAQELVTVAPEAVHQPADPEEMMAVDYSKLVPMLVKEIQSLRARVASLESN